MAGVALALFEAGWLDVVAKREQKRVFTAPFSLKPIWSVEPLDRGNRARQHVVHAPCSGVENECRHVDDAHRCRGSSWLRDVDHFCCLRIIGGCLRNYEICSIAAASLRSVDIPNGRVHRVCVGSGGTLKKARTKMTLCALRTRLFLPPILCARVFYLWYLHLGRFEKCTLKKARTNDVTSTSYPGFYPRSCVLGYFTWVDLKSIPQVLG